MYASYARILPWPSLARSIEDLLKAHADTDLVAASSLAAWAEEASIYARRGRQAKFAPMVLTRDAAENLATLMGRSPDPTVALASGHLRNLLVCWRTVTQCYRKRPSIFRLTLPREKTDRLRDPKGCVGKRRAWRGRIWSGRGKLIRAAKARAGKARLHRLAKEPLDRWENEGGKVL